MTQDIAIDTIIREYGPGQGRHWFDRDTMRFFKTRLPQGGYTSVDGKRVYFVTSEHGPHMPRKYSVRVWDRETRGIGTMGEFNSYTSRSAADRVARGYALMPKQIYGEG